MPCHVVPASQSSVRPSSPIGSASLARPAATLLAGCWKLGARRALSLHPREPGVLVVAHGRAWVTLMGAVHALSADHVLHAGDRLSVAAGQHAVIEAWGQPGAAEGALEGTPALAFRWDSALPMACTNPPAPARADGAAAVAVCWDRAVAPPLRDLRQALGQGGRALVDAATDAAGAVGRLVRGLGRWAAYRWAWPRRLA